MPIRRITFGILIHFLALLLCLAPAAAPAQELHPADYAGLLVVLSQLKQNLDSVTNTVDLETANRIKQIRVSLDAVIKES